MTNLIIKTKKGKREIGPSRPVFIVAEMSGNHNQSLASARQIVEAAAAAGADAVKLQTYTPDTITLDSDKDWFRIKKGGSWEGQTLYQLYKSAYTPWEWQAELKEQAESLGLVFFSTPFDFSSVDFLESLKTDLYKIASFEVVDIPLLEKVGKTGKPVIMSRGMASLEELELAVETLKKNGTLELAILHCVSAYPAKISDMNLATIADLKARFGVPCGLSDHSLGDIAAIAAAASGASIIEKHLTLSRADGGPDAAFSLEPQEFKLMVKAVREAESAIGKPGYSLQGQESDNVAFRKSLFVVEDIKKGETFTEKNLRSIRPGYGLAPKHYHQVLGRYAKRDIERGTPLSREDIE